MIPAPKYDVGDEVWAALSETRVAPTLCPECNGTGHWTATAPTGATLEIDCPACTYGRIAPQYPVFAPTPGVRPLTIGSVRVDTNADRPVSYMAFETGVGSGTIWYDDRLFRTSEEALAASVLFSAARAHEQNDNIRKDYEQRARKQNAAAAAREARRKRKLEAVKGA
jgi:hypothetical protein